MVNAFVLLLLHYVQFCLVLRKSYHSKPGIVVIFFNPGFESRFYPVLAQFAPVLVQF